MMNSATITEVSTKPKKVLDFLNDNKLPYILLNMKVWKDKSTGEIKKTTKEIPVGWKKLSYDKLMKKYNNERITKPTYYNAMCINCYDSNLVVVDIDKKESKSENTIDNMRTFNDYPKYVEKKVAPKFKVKKAKKIELNVSDSNPIDMSPEQKEIVDNIDAETISNYENWMRIMWGLYNTFENVDICVEVSKRDTKKFRGVDDVIEIINCDTKHLITFGTIEYYSRKSNQNNYYRIKEKYNDEIELDDMELSQLYLNLIGDSIIYDKTGIFIYENPFWNQLCGKNYSLRNSIYNTLKDFIKIRNDRLIDELTELSKKLFENPKDKSINTELNFVNENLKNNNKLLRSIGSNGRLKALNECVLTIICSKSPDDYSMNSVRPEIFCFKNKAFDMKKKEETPIYKYDYISIHCGYNYFEPTSEHIETIKNMVKSIMPNKERYRCLLSILKQGCIGKQTPYFVFFNGGGSNGKGVINEHLQKVLGEYMIYSNKEFLLKPIVNGANSTLANLNLRRYVVFGEPEENEQINAGTIKFITDNPIITGRGLYEEKDRNILLHGMNIIECNVRPDIRGRKDNALFRRFIDLLFEITFTDDPDFLKLPNHHKKDSKMKDDDFIKEHRTAFFHLLLEADYDLYIPQCVKERGADFLMGNDELLNWINSRYDQTNNSDDYVTIKEIYNEFKQGDFYRQLTSQEKRGAWSQNNFKENIKANLLLRKFYKDKKNIKKNGKPSSVNTILEKYKIKV